MRWLKTLVIGMGVVIVIGLTVVIVEVVRRAGEPAVSATHIPSPPSPPVIGAAAPAGTFGDFSISIPIGATAEEIVPDGARLIVRLRLSDGRAALLLIDPATGRKLGLITLDSRADAP